jgi:hypothetical protein
MHGKRKRLFCEEVMCYYMGQLAEILVHMLNARIT